MNLKESKVYGKVWREDREGRNVIISKINKNK